MVRCRIEDVSANGLRETVPAAAVPDTFLAVGGKRADIRPLALLLAGAPACAGWRTLTVMPAVPKSRKFVGFPFGPVRPNIVRKRIIAPTGIERPTVVSEAVPRIRCGGPKAATPSPPRDVLKI